MPLKIFISSVSGDLDAERKALESGIRKLGELYVGMEYFGSDPRSALEFDNDAVDQCDLCVGLLGDRYGSIERGSGKSFTELEYDAARAKRIPILVYFKNAFRTGSEEEQQASFKQRVRLDQLGAVFQDAHELEIQFLIDLFKQIRGPLFAKLRPQLGSIPFDALHAVTKSLLPDQIRTVGQDKYISKLYVARPAEDRVRNFVDFEEYFTARSHDILNSVELIAGKYEFGIDARQALADARAATLRSHDPAGLERAALTLKRACFFDNVESDFARLEQVYRQKGVAEQRRMSADFVASLRGLPYIDPSTLPELFGFVFGIAQEGAVGGEPSADDRRAVRSVFPSILVDRDVILANDLLKEFDRLIEKSSKRCIALVDRAGRGKTNVACRIAESTLEKHPVILLSGQMEISTEYHIEWHIQRQIETAFGAGFVDWIPRSAPALEQERRWLLIVVDGINESANLPLLVRVLQHLLPKLADKRIKLILSCRDIYWDLFLPSLRAYLFEDAIPLNEFSGDEWGRAIGLYFERFRISAEVQPEAALSLRNPLLLRFFCEAFQGKDIGRILEVHLRSVFKLYLERIGRTIAERKGLVAPDLVVSLLIRIVNLMWQSRLPSIEQSRLGLTPEETASSESVYNLVRSENVIFDERRHVQSTAKIVRYVYDEFMEYMLAQSWLDTILGSREEDAAIDALLGEAVDAIIAFPSAMGAILFLDQMLERSGRLVNRAVSMLGSVRDVLLHSRQLTLLYALENIDPASVDDNLLDTVDRFEVAATSELRPRLAHVILRLLEKNPGRSALRPVVVRMLEVGSAQEHTTQEVPISVSESLTSESAMRLRNWQVSADVVMRVSSRLEVGEADILLLPPARHHYTEETKLNAISLLISSRNLHDYELVEQGIRKLGRMDLHSALFALQSVDVADDNFVYNTIEGYLDADLPEYRIYCAWLLRERYGRRPSEFLLRLLSADETRVHTYTFSLFDTRQIEKELVDGIRVEMTTFERMKPWHLVYRIKLFGKRTSFAAPADFERSGGESCASALRAVTKHRLPYVRLAAYRSLAAYPEFVPPQSLTRWMQADADPHIQALAELTANVPRPDVHVVSRPKGHPQSPGSNR